MRSDDPGPITPAATLGPVTAEAGKPLYLVARDAIRSAIDGGGFLPGQQMPSTADISRQMNVSLVTAHRALGELVSDGLLRRLHGRGTFVRDGAAGDAATRAAARVGLVLHRESSLADHYHGQVFEGVRRGAGDRQIDLVLLRFGEDLRGECDGLLYVNPLPGELAAVVERAGRRPCVVVGAGVAGVAAVDTDNLDLAEQAVDHLIGLGHRHVGYVGGGEGPGATSNGRDRWRGFVRACDERGVSVDPRHVLQAESWQLDDQERRRLTAMFGQSDRPTAVLAAGYYYALDALAAAESAGLDVPGDLSVIGVDDPPSAQHLSPSLTTFRQPLVELGQTGVALLAARLSSSDGATNGGRTLRAELVVRDSTGPAAKD